MREARKRVEIKGLRVYSRVAGDNLDDPEEWCPRVTGATHVQGGGHDDAVHANDVIVGMDDLAATLTLTARSKVADTNRQSNQQVSGFDVKLELHGEVQARARPSQAQPPHPGCRAVGKAGVAGGSVVRCRMRATVA